MKLLLDTTVISRLCHPARGFSGLPTGSSLDADTILAAQALEISGAVVTDNLRHLERLVPSYRWQEVPL